MFYKKLIPLACWLAPNAVTAYAYKKLTNPQVYKLRPHEVHILDKAQKSTLAFKDFTIQLYKWGKGAKKILLIHGWEGQAGNFAEIIPLLTAQNYTVYAFDAPSHGASSKGKTSLFEFTELVGILIKKYGVDNLISHSFGGVAATYALSIQPELRIKKYVLLTVSDKFTERIDFVAQQEGISNKVKNKLINRLEKELHLQVHELNVSNFVTKVSVQNALIIHDEADKIIPIAQAKNVVKQWPNANLTVIKGTGHFRILRTPKVHQRLMQFLHTP